jgi:hypothetical protein
MLFIGGYADGRQIDVPIGMQHFTIREPYGLALMRNLPEIDRTFRVHHYEKQRLMADDKEYFIMVYVDLQGDCIGALIHGYSATQAGE